MTSPRPAPYSEARSALNGPLLACGLAPFAGELVCLTLGLVTGQSWWFVLMGPLFGFVVISSGLLYRNWPTGIRLDEAGLSIGAIGPGRAGRRSPTVSHQSWGLFTCPWSAVAETRIVTDLDELRQLRTDPRYYTLTNRWSNKAGMRRCNVGVLTSPLMRAALVIEVNPSAVTTSQVRPARFYTNFKDGQFSHLVRPVPSPTWIVPTRHPDELTAALRAVSGKRGFV